MDGQQPVDALDLDNQSVVDDEVEPVAAFELCALVVERDGPLAFEPKPELAELVSEAVLVRRFQ